MVALRRMSVVILAVLLALGLGAAVAPAPVAADSPVVYTVTWGDTLFSIAARYGTSVYALMRANGLRNANYITIGQRLLISGSYAPVPPASSTYIVQPGDTLFSIATRYGTTAYALKQANRLYNYWIYVGQVLRIPGPAAPPAIPVPPTSGGTYYIVQPGDYLGLIAARFGTTAYAIQVANRLYNASFIWVGQRLFIPGASAPYYPPPAPYYPPPAPYNPPPYYPPPYYPPPVPYYPPAGEQWSASLVSNTSGNGPCSLAVTVSGKDNWPVVLSSLDNGTTTDPKYTGSKPERGPYVVEFAMSCTGTWRVIPLGLNASIDVVMNGGHAEVLFQRTY